MLLLTLVSVVWEYWRILKQYLLQVAFFCVCKALKMGILIRVMQNIKPAVIYHSTPMNFFCSNCTLNACSQAGVSPAFFFRWCLFYCQQFVQIHCIHFLFYSLNEYWENFYIYIFKNISYGYCICLFWMNMSNSALTCFVTFIRCR